MKTRHTAGLLLGGVALLLGALAGCQTWKDGMTLPSPRYLEHAPQYFPKSPPYPHSRELAAMERQNAGPIGAPLPPDRGGAPADIIPPP